MRNDDLAQVLEQITVGAVGVTTRALAEATPGFEMTFPQWRALLILGAEQDGARVSEVAGRVGVTLPATGRLLRRLERRGLLALETDPDDRRATRARLTEAGQATRDAILAYRRRMLTDVAHAVTLPRVAISRPGSPRSQPSWGDTREPDGLAAPARSERGSGGGRSRGSRRRVPTDGRTRSAGRHPLAAPSIPNS